MKNLRKGLLIPAFILFPLVSGAADIRGRVLQATDRQPLEFATVSLRQTDSTIVGGTMTNANGEFTVSAPSGTYTLEAFYLGFKTCTLKVSVPSEIEITLEEDPSEIAAARLTEKVKLVEMKMDKLVMNVSQSTFAQSSDGLELMKKAPGVTVDKDGNVQLNGKTVAVWIDGRPSHLDGESLKALLKSTSGDTIESFEIMEHPSSKYDAAGQGGIINIKTKKNFAQGLNGSLGINGGGMYFGGDIGRFIPDESAWVNAAYKGKKTNTFVNLFHTYYDFATEFKSDTRQTVGGGERRLETDGLQNSNGHYWQVKAGNDWFIDDKNTLGFIITAPGSTGKDWAVPEHNRSVTTINDVVTEDIRSRTDNSSRMIRTTANLNYTHVFDAAKSSELTVNADWYRNSSPADDFQRNCDATGAESFRNIKSDNIVNIYSVKADWQTIFWKTAMLEAGAKWSMSVTDHDNSREETGMPTVNTAFDYREHIAAIYVNAAKQFSPKWSAKIGLRGEYTNSLGQWKSDKPDTRRSYFNLFPTVFVGYNPSEKVNLALSYTRRIQRPHYRSLNPVENYIDAHTVLKGNPDLRPSFTNSLNFTASVIRYFSFSLGYNHTADMQSQIPSFTESGDQSLTYDNFGTSHLCYLSANMSSYPIAKWLDWTVNLSAMYSANVLPEQSRNSGFGMHGYTCLTFNLPKDWKIELDGWYHSPMHWSNVVTGHQWSSDLGVKKTMLDGKLTLSLNVDDIFRSSSDNLRMTGIEGLSSIIKQKYCSQSVKVGLTWNFGRGKQAMRRRNVGSIEEESRIGGGGSGPGISQGQK